MRKRSNTPPTAATSVEFGARRQLLRATALVALVAFVGDNGAVAATTDARKLPAQIGDELVFPSWENDGRLITLEDLVPGAAPVLAYPRDPSSAVVRERSRLNQILLMRFDEATLDPAQLERAVKGVFAYSGLCTHTACGVSEWDPSNRHLLCPCHGSAFDPLNNGVRVAGPAPRSLPSLPIALRDERIVIAGAFTATLGASA